MTMRTPLYQQHQVAGARLVDFAGWEMPVHYGSQIDEHHSVRRMAGMFDVSHMTVIDLGGDQCTQFLRYLLANDVAKLKVPGKALYTCMLNDNAGVIDDLIVYFLSPTSFRIVVNAATRARDLEWIGQQAEKFAVEITERDDLAMIAVQGPQARDLATSCLPASGAEQIQSLGIFRSAQVDEFFIARTGYTGEDGFEIILPAASAPALWDKLLAAGVTPCGLGARDTLRLEAGLNLYGQDMDETITPLESGLGWTIAWDPSDREFIGRLALAKQKAEGARFRFAGLLLEGRGVLRAHQRVLVEDCPDGETTSGSFSPTLERSIALARVPVETGERCLVEIRGRQLPVRVVRPPFVRNGEIKINLDNDNTEQTS